MKITGRLSDIYKFQYGKGNDNPDNGGAYPVYGSNGIIGGYDKYNNEDAPVIGHIGANAGSVVFAKGKHYVTYNGVMCIIKDNADKMYGYYALLAANIKRIAFGSAQPFVSYNTLNRIPIYLPTVENQKKISSILSAYDKLIEVNNKRIKVLEQMAENLYKEWFVRFRFPGHETAEFENGIPKGWEYCTVESLSDILQRGISPDYDDEGKMTVISQKCIRQSIMDIKEARKQSKPFKAELNLRDGDTVICSTGTGTLGRVGQVFGDYPKTTFDSHVTLVRAKNADKCHFLYWTLKEMQTWFMNMGIGSTNQQEL